MGNKDSPNMKETIQKALNNSNSLNRDRIATQCVCCGSKSLSSSPAILMPFVAHRCFNWQPVKVDETWGLKTIDNGNVYSICNSMLCNECNFLFLDIRFTEQELENLYKDYRGTTYSNLREFYEPGYSTRNEFLKLGIVYLTEVESFLKSYITTPPITILDWGGDTGINTPFKNECLFIDIYDISNKKPIEKIKSVSKEVAFTKKYDLIVCMNVLEHTPYPSDVILDIKNTMNSNSILYIEVPFEEIMRTEEINQHIKKKHWHEHINFFSKNSLICLLNSCGFDIIGFKSDFKDPACYTSGYLFQIACQLK